MAQQFKVSRGCSIVGLDGKLYREGEILPPGYAPRKKIDDHVRSRHVTPIGSQDQIRIEQAPTAPGVEPPKPTSSGEHATGVTTSEGGVQKLHLDPPATATTGTVAQSDPSPWTIDPSTLEGKDVDELNVMILERDPEQETMETVEEAVAFLSQDYVPEKSGKRSRSRR